MNGKMNIYYDEESDYLEIYIKGASPTYGEEMGDGITVFKKEDNDEVAGVGILSFKLRANSLDEINLKLPFKINFSV